MSDISTREDVEKLVQSFYTRVRADKLIGPIFSDVDWDHHMPIMYNFWSSILLGDASYLGNPFQKHINKGLKPEHFTRWLELFFETVDEHFDGHVAGEAKSRAETIARLFKYKLGLMEE
jgi:hemoglobin